jgi:hypothetical protein
VVGSEGDDYPSTQCNATGGETVIKVVRIAGESYDLETGSELSKAIVLSNGAREISIHVDDNIIGEIVQMMTEAQGGTLPMGPSKPQVPQPTGGNGGLEPPDVKSPSPPLVKPKVKLEAELAAAEAAVSGEEFEPGEEYDDPGTGAASW